MILESVSHDFFVFTKVDIPVQAPGSSDNVMLPKGTRVRIIEVCEDPGWVKFFCKEHNLEGVASTDELLNYDEAVRDFNRYSENGETAEVASNTRATTPAADALREVIVDARRSTDMRIPLSLPNTSEDMQEANVLQRIEALRGDATPSLSNEAQEKLDSLPEIEKTRGGLDETLVMTEDISQNAVTSTPKNQGIPMTTPTAPRSKVTTERNPKRLHEEVDQTVNLNDSFSAISKKMDEGFKSNAQNLQAMKKDYLQALANQNKMAKLDRENFEKTLLGEGN